MSTENYMLAIDFGTSRIKVAYLYQGKSQMAPLGEGGRSYMPSLFYLSPSGDVEIGDNAASMLNSDPVGVVDILKQKLREPWIRKRRVRKTPSELLTILFQSIRTRCHQELPHVFSEEPTEVILTYPARYSQVERDILRKAALSVGFEKVHTISEPEAAALAWQHKVGASLDSTNLIILDCGGGTVDWTCLQSINDQLQLYSEVPPGGDENIGGHNVDEELLELLKEKVLKQEKDELLDIIEEENTKYLHILRNIKEKYSRLGKITDSDIIMVGDCKVQLNQKDLEDTFQVKIFEHLVTNFSIYLQKIRELTQEQTPTILLVGGTGKIRGLKQVLETQCNVKVVLWMESEFATVQGALYSLQSLQKTPPVENKPLPVENKVAPKEQNVLATEKKNISIDDQVTSTEEKTEEKSGIPIALIGGLCVLVIVVVIVFASQGSEDTSSSFDISVNTNDAISTEPISKKTENEEVVAVHDPQEIRDEWDKIPKSFQPWDNVSSESIDAFEKKYKPHDPKLEEPIRKLKELKRIQEGKINDTSENDLDTLIKELNELKEDPEYSSFYDDILKKADVFKTDIETIEDTMTNCFQKISEEASFIDKIKNQEKFLRPLSDFDMWNQICLISEGSVYAQVKKYFEHIDFNSVEWYKNFRKQFEDNKKELFSIPSGELVIWGSNKVNIKPNAKYEIIKHNKLLGKDVDCYVWKTSNIDILDAKTYNDGQMVLSFPEGIQVQHYDLILLTAEQKKDCEIDDPSGKQYFFKPKSHSTFATERFQLSDSSKSILYNKDAFSCSSSYVGLQITFQSKQKEYYIFKCPK